MAIRNYDEALAFLFNRIDYERSPAPRTGKRAFRLARMRALVERLGNPHVGLPVLHVAGTKGKGSTAAMLASILSAAGYRTGLYSSPHLYRLEERMTIDGRLPAPEQVVELVRLLQPHVEAMDRAEEPGPTFFELTTAMALVHFRRCRVDAAVVEVGLGGRLDSTNVCLPTVSIITSISRDHTRQLGGRLAQIAREKAGIVKPGVPVVSGVLAEPARGTIAGICAEREAELWQLGGDFNYDYDPAAGYVDEAVIEAIAIRGPGSEWASGRVSEWAASGVRQRPGTGGLTPIALNSQLSTLNSQRRVHTPHPTPHTPHPTLHLAGFPSPATFDVQTPVACWTRLPMPLWGEHQAANGSVAIAALDHLRLQGWRIPAEAVGEGLERLRWPARFELLCRRPDVVIDAAHNDASTESVARTLETSFPAQRRILVFGTTREKDAKTMLRRLLPLFDELLLTRYQNNPRGVPPEELADLVRQLNGPSPSIHPRPSDAWSEVRRRAGTDSLICVTGSFFLAAEMREQVLADPFPTAVFARGPEPSVLTPTV